MVDIKDNLVGSIWTSDDRPPLQANPISPHYLNYTGNVRPQRIVILQYIMLYIYYIISYYILYLISYILYYAMLCYVMHILSC